MTGPEHYREAQEHLTDSDYERREGRLQEAMYEAAVAQVHATLALAAATALGVGGDNPPPDDAEDWWRAAGTRDPDAGRPDREEDVDDA